MQSIMNHEQKLYTTTLKQTQLDFRVNFKVKKTTREGFLGLRSKTEELVILNDVKGTIKSGTMTALLGASGCGKSTLLAALSQRLRGEYEAEITFNGDAIDRTHMTDISGFVPQNDVYLDGLTVREHIYFMIRLKLPHVSSLEKSFLMQSTLVKFGLDEHTNVQHLSGGEKRKLSLATELLTKPQILFCDEPTSGLDSFSAYSVMSTLCELAGFSAEPKLFQKPPKASRIILFSIHQPTSDIFHLFTNIILMNAGRIIFHGTVEEAKNLFSDLGMPVPERYNPAEFFVNRISDPMVSDQILGQLDADKKSSFSYDDGNISFSSVSQSSDDRRNLSQQKLPWIEQVTLLSHRSVLSFLHNPRHYLIELLILIMFALIITITYSGISLKSKSAIQDVRGFLTILATEILFVFIYTVFFIFYEILPLLRKEAGDRLYSLSAYYFSMVVLMIPRVVFETLVFTAIIYFSTDIGRDFWMYCQICMCIIPSGLTAIAYGFFLAGLFESFFIGTELSAITDLVLLLVSGIYTNVKTVSFLKYISFFFYANENVAISFWTSVEKIKCHHGKGADNACLSDGYAVLDSLGFGTTAEDMMKDFAYQFVLFTILHVLAFLGIRKHVRRTGFY